MLIDTARLLLRRWRLVALALVLTLAAGAGAAVLGPWRYESRAQVLFLPPTVDPGIEGQINPFLALGPALRVTADIVRLDVVDDSTRAELVARGAVEEYEIEPYLADNGGPILNVTVEGPDADRTRLTVDLVSARIIEDLRTIQDSARAPSGSYISASVLTRTPEPEPSVKDKVRLAAVLAPAVLVLLLASIIVQDRFRGRSARRADAGDATADAAGTPPRGPADGVPPAEEGAAPAPVADPEPATPASKAPRATKAARPQPAATPAATPPRTAPAASSARGRTGSRSSRQGSGQKSGRRPASEDAAPPRTATPEAEPPARARAGRSR